MNNMNALYSTNKSFQLLSNMSKYNCLTGQVYFEQWLYGTPHMCGIDFSRIRCVAILCVYLSTESNKLICLTEIEIHQMNRHRFELYQLQFN